MLEITHIPHIIKWAERKLLFTLPRMDPNLLGGQTGYSRCITFAPAFKYIPTLYPYSIIVISIPCSVLFPMINAATVHIIVC